MYKKKGSDMNIEQIIRAWKAEEDEWEASEVASPVGQGLTEEEMLGVSGGSFCICTASPLTLVCIDITVCISNTCSPSPTCGMTCGMTCETAITGPCLPTLSL